MNQISPSLQSDSIIREKTPDPFDALQNGFLSLENPESGEETCEILRQMLKSAFVIGRRHINQLV